MAELVFEQWTQLVGVRMPRDPADAEVGFAVEVPGRAGRTEVPGCNPLCPE